MIKYIIKIINFLKRHISAFFNNLYWNLIPIKNGINNDKRDYELIVSLTSFPARIKKLNITIKSIMKQSLKADKIILYLGIDTPKNLLPNRLLKLQKKGLEIKYDYPNLKPHKKYLYAILENPNSFIITIDDDLIYSNNMIEDLWNTHLKYPECICARRVHLMKSINNNILPYNKWEQESSSVLSPSHSLFSTNGAGTLIPPDSFDDISKNSQLIEKLCLNADDIWIKFNFIRMNKKIVWTGSDAYMPKEILYKKSKRQALMNDNVTNNRNDEYIQTLQNYFNINLADFC